MDLTKNLVSCLISGLENFIFFSRPHRCRKHIIYQDGDGRFACKQNSENGGARRKGMRIGLVEIWHKAGIYGPIDRPCQAMVSSRNLPFPQPWRTQAKLKTEKNRATENQKTEYEMGEGTVRSKICVYWMEVYILICAKTKRRVSGMSVSVFGKKDRGSEKYYIMLDSFDQGAWGGVDLDSISLCH